MKTDTNILHKSVNLDTKKVEWKHLIGDSRYQEVFRILLDECLIENRDLWNSLIIVKSRYSNLQNERNIGSIAFQGAEIIFNNVAHAQSFFIDKIRLEDIKPAFIEAQDRAEADKDNHQATTNRSPKKAFAAYHAYSCNRHNQKDDFQEHVYANVDKKVLRFFLYGDSSQALPSLCDRFGFEFCGYFEDFRTEDFQPFAKNLSIDIDFVPRPNLPPSGIFTDIVSKLVVPFSIRPNPFGLNRFTILDLLKSPKLNGFGENDMVFLLLNINAEYWDKAKTPEMVVDFLDKFCATVLPETAPRFFIFFGVKYDKNEPEKRKEVADAILNRRKIADLPEDKKHDNHLIGGLPLDELLPVPSLDVELWFEHYNTIFEDTGQSSKELAEALLENKPLMDMNLLENKLKQCIEDHNKKQAIQAHKLKG